MTLAIAMVSEHASPLAALGDVDAGGQNVHVAMLATALAARGHQITVYTRRDDPGLPRQVPLTPGVTVEHLPAGPALPLPKDELFAYLDELTAHLRQALKRRPADLLHSHFWMSGLAALAAGGPLNIPVVHTFHALGAVKRRWQGEADTSPAVRIPAERELARSVHGIIATCRDEVHELANLGVPDVPAGRIQVVPSGVDTHSFQPTGPTVARGRLRRLITVGRLVPRKGIDDLLTALVDIPQTELVVLGGPPPRRLAADPVAGAIVDRATQLGVADRVRMVGRANRAAVAGWIRSSDLVVCAPWYEPFGIVPLEAMACGVPVIGTAVGGLLDTVVDGQTGVLVPPRRPDRLAAAIVALLDDPHRRMAMGRAGRARAVANYDWQQVAARTENGYRHLLALPRPLRGDAGFMPNRLPPVRPAVAQ